MHRNLKVIEEERETMKDLMKDKGKTMTQWIINLHQNRSVVTWCS